MILNSLNNISKYQEKNLNVIIILFSWILLWAAVGAKPENITAFLFHTNITLNPSVSCNSPKSMNSGESAEEGEKK